MLAYSHPVFVNVFYEFNNYLLDFVFSEKSNLKCAAYGDIHTAAEKTNFGGQASYPQVRSFPRIYSEWDADMCFSSRWATRLFPSRTSRKAAAGVSTASSTPLPPTGMSPSLDLQTGPTMLPG